jgi:uncharacterized protein YfaQ (DUF2300 family)
MKHAIARIAAFAWHHLPVRMLALAVAVAPLSTWAHEAAGPAVCEPLPVLQGWLDRHAAQWDGMLRAEPGYERPARVQVCRQPGEWPFADNRAGRVYVRRLQTEDDAVTLAHEYVHLAFRDYPSGHDEIYVEQTARRLIAAYP